MQSDSNQNPYTEMSAEIKIQKLPQHSGANNAQRQIKALTLVTKGLSRPTREEEENDRAPRASLYERTLNSDMLDEHMMEQAPRWRKFIYRRLPQGLSQVLEAYALRKNYDVIVSWYDGHALLLAALFKLTHTKFPHVGLLFWPTKPKKAILLKHVFSKITCVVLWTSHHWNYAINRLGIPPDRLRLITYYTDQKFWRPMPRETDMICSAGREMRDYVTLIEAMKGLDIKCHLAMSIRAGQIFSTVKRVYQQRSLPPNITVGSLPPTELRALYARSRFVVVPLLPSDSDNGITVILEAMAMGKAVICSRVEGQRDVIIDGKTGILVDQGNPIVLRDAIKYLWNNPEIADRMGREGRKRIEEMFTWDQFVNNVRNFAEEAIALEATPSKAKRKTASTRQDSEPESIILSNVGTNA